MIKKLCIILIIFESYKNIREIIILKMGKSSNGKNKSERVARGRSTATNRSETRNNNIAHAPNQARSSISAPTDPNSPSDPRRRVSAPGDGSRRPVFSPNNFASNQDVLTGSDSDSRSGDFSYETENIKDMVIKIQLDENATKYNVRSLRQRVGNIEKTLQDMTEKIDCILHEVQQMAGSNRSNLAEEEEEQEEQQPIDYVNNSQL